jgi:hypothetical protein
MLRSPRRGVTLLTLPTPIDTVEMVLPVKRVRPSTPNNRPRRLARPRTPPFHGDNTGSNPVGDAK